MSKPTRFLLSAISWLFIAAFSIGRGTIVTAHDEQLPTVIGDSNSPSMDSDHFVLNWNVAASGGGTIFGPLSPLQYNWAAGHR